ncbi:hypothetical protein LX36DRAFT_663171 [Colletotrichum falcatum]|nr:hypothetical protein LX36DRAFT_663171 [Colletotrichum falcatum]
MELGNPSVMPELPKAIVSSASSGLKFVTISHPDDIRQRKDVRTEIRRHVMTNKGLQRRQSKAQREGRASLASSRAPMKQGGRRNIPPGSDTALGTPCMALPVPWRFPTEANDRAVELFRFCMRERIVSCESCWPFAYS